MSEKSGIQVIPENTLGHFARMHSLCIDIRNKGKRIYLLLEPRLKMPNTYCILSSFEADQLRDGIEPNCNHHRHCKRQDALVIASGGKHYPWYSKEHDTDFRWNPIGEWCVLPDGKRSTRHLIIHEQREWRSVKSVMQWIPIGSKGRTTGNRYKLHCKMPRAPQCKTIKG